MKRWLAILAGLFSVFWGSIAFSDAGSYGFCPLYGAMMSWGWGGMLIGILVIVLLVYLVVRFLGESPRKDKNGALEILRKRYARGEISEKEYQRMKSELEE